MSDFQLFMELLKFILIISVIAEIMLLLSIAALAVIIGFIINWISKW